jgi:NADP-dependent 3-hydroxy acid dehydrogenase YdfG
MEKYVFITGATSGFGEACAKGFGKNGWNLVITGRRNDRLNKLADDLKSAYSIDCISLSR